VTTRTLRPRLPRVAAALACCGVLAAPLNAFSSGPPPVSEHEVKAAVLYRVAKFIEWPASSFSGPQGPFVMCVVGAEAPLRAFSSLEGKRINAHPVTVRRVTGDMLDLRQCHAAFFPADSAADVDYALGKLQGAPVLTVGETDEFARRGGSLALVTRDQRVRFTVNLPASKRSGLNVSSQLLQLATVVGESKP
jgi:hypothetical protein